MKRLLIAGVVMLLVAAPGFADVTLKMTMAMSGGPTNMQGQMVMYVKGLRARTEVTAGPAQQVVIFDLVSKKVITLTPAEKVVQIADMATYQGELSQKVAGMVTIDEASATPTGQKKTLLGSTCEERLIAAKMSVNAPSETMTMTLSGSSWTPIDGPGFAELAAFAKAAKESGLPTILGSAFAGQSGGPFGPGTQLQKLGAESGVPSYLTEISMATSGAGQMASMMAQFGPMKNTVTVTSVSTDPVDEALFKVPEGYTVKGSAVTK